MNTRWRFVSTGFGSGAYNMEFDEQLARDLLAGLGVPTVRLFRWKPWAVSLGYNQRLEDVDVEKCHANGIDIVRRPTGGRAILHAEELTYCVVMHAGRKGVLQIYNEISNALVTGLQFFGVDVNLQRTQPNFPEEYKRVPGIACFTSSARYEIEWQGRKLVGSAQRRFADGSQDVVLQHGSILCGPAHQRLVDYLHLGGRSAEDFRHELRDHTVDLSAILGRIIDLKGLAFCIRHGFESNWGIEFEDNESLASIQVPSSQEVDL